MRKKRQVGIDELEQLGFKVERVHRVSTARRVAAFPLFILSAALAGTLVAALVLGVLSVGVTYAKPLKTVWDNMPKTLADSSLAGRITMLDKNGQVFAEVYSQDRIILSSLSEIAPVVVDALVSTEDKNFFKNQGVDWLATARAAATHTGGGSGITQQLVKNLQYYDTESNADEKSKAVEHSLARKVKELRFALEYERTHTKNEILLKYLNTVAMGRGDVYGIESAAQRIFGVSAKNLDLAHAAALIGSANNPALYQITNDVNDPWKSRQQTVLDALIRDHKISQQERDSALKEPLQVIPLQRQNSCYSSKYPFYCDYVLKHIKSDPFFGATPDARVKLANDGGFTVSTFLDPAQMEVMQKRIDEDFTKTNRVVAPVVSVQPGTGGVEAMVVNRNWGDNPGETTINVPLNPTGVGSTFKMITLATAFDQGMSDKQLTFAGGCRASFPGYDSPPGGFKNSSSCGLSGGRLDYLHATAYSSNTWFVTLAKKVGVENIKKMAQKMGLNPAENIGAGSLSYTLGPVAERPTDYAAAFATFANGGVFCPATPVKTIVMNNGQKMSPADGYDPRKNGCRRAMSPKTASKVLTAMRANISGEIPNAFGVDQNIPGTAAKSGTNQLFNSTWVHVSGNHVLFGNMYDMDKLVNGIETVWWRQKPMNWSKHAMAFTVRDMLAEISQLPGDELTPLDFNSRDAVGDPVDVKIDGMVQVPSVIGMQPREALSVLRSAGIKAEMSKQKVNKKPDRHYPDGVILSQSIAPGSIISVSGKTVVILKR